MDPEFASEDFLFLGLWVVVAVVDISQFPAKVIQAPLVGKPLTATLLTSTFVFRSGGLPFRGFEVKWSLVATSVEGFLSLATKKGYQGPLLKD